MAIQRRQRHRLRCRREAAAVRVEAVARGRITRQSMPPKAEPTSSAYCSPRAAGSELDLASVRGLVFKRSRGWPHYQLRYLYFRVDSAGQAALCHRARDAVGGGTGVEKQLPCSSITAVHVESWGRCVVTLALGQPQPLPSPSPAPAPAPARWSDTSSRCTRGIMESPRAGIASIASKYSLARAAWPVQRGARAQRGA